MTGWLDLKGASRYVSLSVRTLRRYIGDAQHPLPARLVGGKWLITRDELDAWLRDFPRAGEEIDQVVDEVLRDLHIGERPRWQRKSP